MNAMQIMTRDVACCRPDTKLNQVARMMVEHDCGEIPVADEQNRLVGVITDRDICCRAVAQDCNPCEVSAGEIMSSPVVSATLQMSVEECVDKMEQHQIRRIPVVDEKGCCCGIIAQADVARNCDGQVKELVKSVSEPTTHASAR